MKHGTTIVLFLLVGCGGPETSTGPDSQIKKQSDTEVLLEASSDIPWTSYPYPDPAAAHPEEFTARVIQIVDGDTIDVLTDAQETIRIRLHGIDAPESDQPLGDDARVFLSLIAGKKVRVVKVSENESGDIFGEVYCHLGGSHPVESHMNFMVVANGRGWHDTNEAPDRYDLATAEQRARDTKLVIWSGSQEPIPPWDWRKMSKEERHGQAQ